MTEHWVQIYSNQKEINYISPSNIRASISSNISSQATQQFTSEKSDSLGLKLSAHLFMGLFGGDKSSSHVDSLFTDPLLSLQSLSSARDKI